MIYADVQYLPGGDPTFAPHLGHVAIINVTPGEDPADYVAAVFDQRLEVQEVRRVEQHDRSHGWQSLLARALTCGAQTYDAQAVAMADRAQQIVIDAVDLRCALGDPVRRLRRIVGDRWPIAEQTIQGRATTVCTGTLCGGTAHGPVLHGSAFEDALAAVLAAART